MCLRRLVGKAGTAPKTAIPFLKREMAELSENLFKSVSGSSDGVTGVKRQAESVADAAHRAKQRKVKEGPEMPVHRMLEAAGAVVHDSIAYQSDDDLLRITVSGRYKDVNFTVLLRADPETRRFTNKRPVWVQPPRDKAVDLLGPLVDALDAAWKAKVHAQQPEEPKAPVFRSSLILAQPGSYNE